MQYIFLSILGYLSIADIKRKEIAIKWPILLLISVMFYWIIYAVFFDKTVPFENIILGGLLGFVICLFSIVSREEIGFCDSLIFLIIGIYKGIYFLFLCLCLSFAIASMASFILFLMNQLNRKDRISFIPYIFIGFAVCCIFQY